MDPLLEIALRAALAGGEEVMRVYADPFEVTQKDDRTPVTEADLASERVDRRDPDRGVFRTSRSSPRRPCRRPGSASPAARFWCVDPLDGTQEFVARNGEFAVLIGLDRARPPGARRRARPGGRGDLCRRTARARRCGGATAASSSRSGRASPSPEGIVVVHSRSHENSRRLAEYFQGRPVIERKQCGSALKFGVLAAGDADFYPRFGTTMEWDTAAGQAVLEAAGGHVFGLDGAPLGYGKPGLEERRLSRLGRPAGVVRAGVLLLPVGARQAGQVQRPGQGRAHPDLARRAQIEPLVEGADPEADGWRVFDRIRGPEMRAAIRAEGLRPTVAALGGLNVALRRAALEDKVPGRVVTLVRKALPDMRWQSVQWQIRTCAGSISASKLILPQWQCPVTFIDPSRRT